MALTILLKESVGTVARHQSVPNQRLLSSACLNLCD